MVAVLLAALVAGCGDDLAAPLPEPPLSPRAPQQPDDPHRASRLYPGPCTEIVASGADGIVELVKHYRYDDLDRKISTEYDTFADGVIDYRQTVEYTAGARVRETDSHGNGIIDTRETTFFDDGGRVVAIHRDHDGDGSADWIQTRSYDGEGRLVTEHTDRDADGLLDEGIRHVRDGDLLVTTEQLAGTDTGSELVTRRIDFQYQSGLVVAELVDDGADDSVERITSTFYDDAQRPVRIELDHDADGSADTAITRTWEAGLLTGETVDEGADGDPEEHESFSYDSDGLLVLHAISGEAGELLLGWRYDDAGREIGSWLDRDGDGSADSSETRGYDEHGNLLSLSRDTSGDGAANVQIDYRYDCF